MANDVLVIGIAGGTGCGKTTITNTLRDKFEGNISVIYHDSYYKCHDEMTYEERTKLNYDHPSSFDTEMLIEDLKSLKAGKAVECPVYDFTVHNRVKNKTNHVEPHKIIIVEGILIFENKELRDLMDIKLYVDTDADTRILRRLLRDVQERGRTMESVITQYLTTVKPMHEMFVEPTRKHADLVFLEGGHNAVALDMLINKIQSHLNTVAVM